VADVVDNADEHRYELLVDGERVGLMTYRDADGRRALVHTEVDDELEGRGLGSELVRGALDQARERGLTIMPNCPFVAAFIRSHPEYEDLVG
jgi:predicted GNAT family acetyltransferase